MSNAIDKCSFYRLLEREVRAPSFLEKVRTVACDYVVTDDTAVESIFLLIDEIAEITDLAAELERIPNKFSRYTEVKYHATQVASVIEKAMRFAPDGNLTYDCIRSLKKSLRDYVNGRKRRLAQKSDKYRM